MSPVLTSTADRQCPLNVIKKQSRLQCCFLGVFLKNRTPSALWHGGHGTHFVSLRASEHLRISY